MRSPLKYTVMSARAGTEQDIIILISAPYQLMFHWEIYSQGSKCKGEGAIRQGKRQSKSKEDS